MGWVLGCLGELHKQERGPVPPTAIIPLGTGNDLSRSFGWVRFSVCLRQLLHFYASCPSFLSGS